MFEQTPTRLIYRHDHETLWIEPWGPNALRIRATKSHAMPPQDWALDEPVPDLRPTISVPASASSPGGNVAAATLTNGLIRATLTPRGRVTLTNTTTNRVLLREYTRNRDDVSDPQCSALLFRARDFVPLRGSDNYALTLRLESLSRSERLYGMGQYQQEGLNLKGADLELAHRNSQASVPFLVSSLGYGLLWNCPSVGRAVLGTNVMSFEASATDKLDYWVVAGDTPRDLVEAYVRVTGLPPMMPEYGLGFWQSKLRYQTQEETLAVVREHKRRGLPMDVIVVDFFHWPHQGDWRFDEDYFPDPGAMVAELKGLGVELMVSIWPTVEDRASENWDEMLERGLLIRAERGFRAVMDFQGNTVHFDATNPEARKFIYDKARQNYGRYGIKLFWLDEAEPEYSAYDFDNWRYHLGPQMSVGNVYPRDYSRAFYEGALAAGEDTRPVNLVRCAWAGSQKFGALVWSGDVASSWESFRQQLAAGLNMGLAGIAHWTTDIGGFHGGNPDDEGFRELLVRWFQCGAFLPVFRLHGDREPHSKPLSDRRGGKCPSGAPNEVWSYGEEAGAILERYLHLRESMRDYVRGLMKEASEKGTPVIRTLFFEFPDDKEAWDVEDEYMFGDRYLVCPVLYPGLRKRKVYFPAGAKWKAMDGHAVFEGGSSKEVDAPLEAMPVFTRQ
ncbi:Alpha-D-xyloside xylohydrolase [Coniochaeta hoffmannii]|uniref:Alpha-D-xyloside xylohydrolase n=1 Tax=Coniochaeta hoffmannii TaxID=91930 RepID=A0AA38SEA4_9PEZI|nr:Alpha-D-xyloside xylohydrolase [Coniochaeta hoffmannii]